MKRWVGKVAVVTGASAGIGAAIVEQLVEEGLQVVGLARRVEAVEELAKKLTGKKGKLHAIKTDITKEEDILNAFKWIKANVGPIHILVNNAGIVQDNQLMTGETAKWRKTFDTNVLGLCIATREAVNSMIDNKIDGHVIHINSVAGHRLFNFPGIDIYAASKHAVTALTETLRHEINHNKLKIKITSVSPGYVDTEILYVNKIVDAHPELRESLPKAPALKSEDIADAVLYALSTPPHVQIHEIIIKPVGEPF